MNKSTIALFTALLLFSSACVAQTKDPYKIIKKIKLLGDEGWDYLTVDSKVQRLFVSHSSKVQVVDLESSKEIGSIPAIGVHGIALANDLGKGFISNGKDSSVTIFDLKTLKLIEKVSIPGKNPDAIMYDPFTQRVFTFNGRSNNSTVIDAKSNKVLGSIPLEGKPEFAVSDGKGNIFVNIEDKNTLVKIDPISMSVKASWPIAPGESASGLAFDIANNRLFLGCNNKMMMVIDATNGKVIQSIPIGDGVDANAYDPGTKLAFSSNGEGTLTVVLEDDPNHFTVVGNITTQKGARTMALDPQTHRVYLPTSDFDPAPPSTDGKKHRPKIHEGSFSILVLDKQ
jgi:YVTN family beta-propeller protein